MIDASAGMSKRPDVVAARLAAIVESSHDAIVAKDLQSTITDWNPAAERMFGYSSDEAVGQPITLIIPENLRTQEIEIISRIRARDRVDSFETVRQRKNGDLIPVSLTVSPILDAEGIVVGASKIARDITRAKEDERRIRVLLREINHRVKNQYAVILSLIRETAQNSDNMDELQHKLRQRILGLAASNDLLVKAEWSGSTLHEIVEMHVGPFGGDDCVRIDGLPIRIDANAVQNIGMAIHELCTNSAKYGVLSGLSGAIVVNWSVESDMVSFSWDETFDSPIQMPDATGIGFGSVVLKRVVPMALGGHSVLDRSGERVRWTLEVPLSRLSQSSDDE